MNRWRVGEDRGSKETNGCPLTETLGETFCFIIFTLYLSLVYSRVCVVFGLSSVQGFYTTL
jgi:hypothetical protein